MRALDTLRPVIGSESLADIGLLRQPDCILSLDFRHGAFLGSPNILQNSALWPGRIIAMTLDYVGGGKGPDFHRLAEIKGMAGEREVYAAGGIRSAYDLRVLRDKGISGALVATALHDGALNREHLAAFRKGNK
jgi:phosphoribosylformimino-5-aminoimidazole carboxamide ribotide isomerase